MNPDSTQSLKGMGSITRTLSNADAQAIAERVVALLGLKLSLPAELHTMVGSERTAREVAQIEPGAVNIDGLRHLIGDPALSDTAAWRLEKRGKIKRVDGIRTRLWTVASVREFITGNMR